MRCCKTTSLSINKLFFCAFSRVVPFWWIVSCSYCCWWRGNGGGVLVHPYSIVYIIDIMFVSSCWLNKEQTLQRSTYTWPLAIFRLNSKPFFKVYCIIQWTSLMLSLITIRAKLRRHEKDTETKVQNCKWKFHLKLYLCISTSKVLAIFGIWLLSVCKCVPVWKTIYRTLTIAFFARDRLTLECSNSDPKI